MRLCFTCDEEIGRGVDQLDLQEIGAVVCYTLDGHGSGEIDVETFSADQAVVTIRGVNIHPVDRQRADDQRRSRVAADFIARLPRDTLSPETTDGREGFLHPYEMSGRRGRGEGEDPASRFRRRQARRVGRSAAAGGRGRRCRNFPRPRSTWPSSGSIATWPKGWRASRGRWPMPKRPCSGWGARPEQTIVRGGTDGSRLTELGLPTPNLSCGGHNPHSPLEWACLEEMVESVEWLVALAEVWAAGEG